MRIIIIGGTGHIGTFLVPRLVTAGHEVVVVSRGMRKAYQAHAAWADVRMVTIERTESEKAGEFGKSIRELKPDAVIDLTCFDIESAQHLVDALRGEIQLLAHCGTVWVRGYGTQVPADETMPRNPITEYGRKKSAIEAYLIAQAQQNGFPATVLHPGHIVGPGWIPVAPTACHDPNAFVRLAHGDELDLPNLGMETLHHVHADDVAQAFEKALQNWSASVGNSFFVVSEAALTLRGYAEAVASWFGQTARLRFHAVEEWKKTLSPEFVEPALAHLTHSTQCSCAKAQKLLNYQPRFTSLEAVYESVMWLVEHGELRL